MICPISSRKDFNGRTTTYGYDNLNRLLAKTADAYFSGNHIGAASVSFTYTTTGRRATMTDASGTTNYGYDNRDRLTSKATPEGTLNYTYDAAGDVKTIQSSNANGANLAYGYDALNRISTVTDPSGQTTYGYDSVGNLQSVTYPNGVVHTYGYDNRNRLTNLGVAKGATQVAGYSYILDASGHRLSVTEQSGRTVSYSYDNLYRLTNETIASDPGGINGAVNYTYDAVGNRKQLTSTLAAVPAGLWNYNANDQLTTDVYDNNGNTTSSAGLNYVYDFENRLVQKGGLTIVYDGDGNRVKKTTPNGTTLYLVDTLNPTGYAQVLAERTPSTLNLAVYVYGLERISKAYYSTQFAGPQGFRYYVYDGHGSVRALTDPNGNVTDTYDYDAFGILIHSTFTSVPPLGNTVAPSPNNYLYSGEQFDADLNLYYNRARYLNVSTGRFWSMDVAAGNRQSPVSLHKYLYASANPVNRIDPSGFADLDISSLSTSLTVASTIASMSNVLVAGFVSAFRGLPDAVGFGVYASGGFGDTLATEGIGGVEILYAPRLKQAAIYWFGGLELEGGPSPFGGFRDPPSLLNPKGSDPDHGPLHGEVGVFTVWYWNLRSLDADPVGILGASFGGGLLAYESGGGVEPRALLFGMSTSLDPSVFGIGLKEGSLGQWSMSEADMLGSVAADEVAFQGLGLARSGASVSGSSAIGGLAALVVSTGAVASWVQHTYGKPAN